MRKHIMTLVAALHLAVPADIALAQPQAFGFGGVHRLVRGPGDTLEQALRRSVRLDRMERMLGRPWRHAGGSDPQAHDAGRTNVAPAIISGRIVSTTINVQTAPAAASIQIKYSSPGYFEYAFFEFVSPSGNQYYDFSIDAEYPGSTAGTVLGQEGYNPFGLYSEAGVWTLTFAGIDDFAGNTTNYEGSQLASIFPSVALKVVNSGMPDSVLPTVAAGEILTPIVSLTGKLPVFRAQMNATDTVSGVTTLGVALVSPDATEYIDAYGYLPSPQKNGTVHIGVDLGSYPDVPMGTWTIGGYFLCDAANNCVNDFSSTDVTALFGTTSFVVK